MFQSLLSWISCIGKPCALRSSRAILFQSLLSWISCIGKEIEAVGHLAVIEFQSLLSWISCIGRDGRSLYAG